jgi:hypothetical protein
MRLTLYLTAMVVLAPILSRCAAAESPSFTVSGGYSNVQIGHKSDLYYNRDGTYVDGEFLLRPMPSSLPLLLGAGFSASGYDDIVYVPALLDPRTIGQVRLASHVGFFSAEARAAMPISFASQSGRGLFLMPRVGAGLLVDDYSITTPIFNLGGTLIDKHKHDRAAFDVRPAIQGGYSWGWGSAGVEVSYMAAFGDFGKLGSIAQEIRAGAFFRVRF